MPANEPIDAVYTWVRGEDSDYGAVRDAWASRLGVTHNPERDRDNLDILKYSLRSLEMYVPWIRTVYLVTARPQVPQWLNPSLPLERLRVVHHDEIFSDANALPTFNSFAIDQNLHCIPGLSERYLYMNDDVLFGRPTLRRDFETPDGRVRVYLERDVSTPAHLQGTVQGPYGQIVAHTNAYLDRRFGPKKVRRHYRHGPVLVIKGLLDSDDPWIRRCVRNRFRTPTDIVFEHAYYHTLLSESTGSWALVPRWEVILRTLFVRLLNNPREVRRSLRRIRWLRPRFYCLNDDLGGKPNPVVVRMAAEFLQRYYPMPSSYERPLSPEGGPSGSRVTGGGAGP